MKKTPLLALLLGVTFLFSCNRFREIIHPDKPGKGKPFREYSNRIILDWNAVAQKTMEGPAYASLLSSRLAMVHLAMHDALNAIAPVYQTYALQSRDSQAEPVAAAASAAHAVLLASFPDKQTLLDSALNQSLATVAAGEGKTRGIALGKQAGQALVGMRQNDGAFGNPIGEVNNPLEPGFYQPVPPTPFVFAPFWATMPPFSLESPSQFRSVPQPALDSKAYADAFHEVKTVGVKNSQTRTADQTAYAKYWYELSEIGWNRITRIAATDQKLDLLTTARLLALVNMALTDSYTAGWDSKFYYNFWRPYTAIRAAETDGNPATAADEAWEPLLDTPPVHDYPSTHSALGNAATTVLASLLGDKTKFTMTSPSADPANATRSFYSFSQAAKENADSRVMAGIHFRFACQAGLELGHQVGKWTVEKHLRPLAQPK
ncbi:MAG: phosphatase PAP2 family protein [Ferruginibacter sp.]|nr:phosphatase PAP2 family protein [Cytophagales bacterium]